MEKEKENEITSEEYKKKHGHYPVAEKSVYQDLKDLKEKGKQHGILISKGKLYDDLYELNPSEKVIYLALRLHADNETKWCCPGMRFLAKKLDLSKNTIQKYILALEKKEFIKLGQKRGKKGKRFEYWLLK